MGAVSAFGFGGSNFHAVLGEYREQAESDRRVADGNLRVLREEFERLQGATAGS